ncbi:peptidylprolyl isomerase [Sphingomonas bacterium]|uniref:peptidylprolyl isomerase n=1 Tax=Sphingomonas bacterium TaxID=1895847 RepID=UPI0015755CF8|nr:peptidylprolyl isomerase [Sphingomonas bacterium]
MIRHLLLACLAATPALAQEATPTPAPLPTPRPDTVQVALVTDQGRIVLELERGRAPITTANFLRYVDGHRLDGTVFYRTVRPAPDFGFIQFGVQNAPKRVLPPIALEPSTQTGVTHTSGAISLARLAPDSGRGDFTINVGDQPSLDADPTRPGDNLGYAAFGHVVEGMDVVKRILDATVDPAKGPFKGETIAAPVRIISAARVAKAGSGGGT